MCGEDKDVNEKFWWERVKRDDAVLLNLVAFGLEGVHFEGESVEERPKFRLLALEQVDLPSKYCGVLVDVLSAQARH